MGDQERRQKAELLLEWQESEERIADLGEEASAAAAKLKEVANLLEQSKLKTTSCGVLEVEQRLARQRAALRESMTTDERYLRALNVGLIADLVDRLESAKQQREELRIRKAALGLW